MRIVKAHAYGNDFVYVPFEDVGPAGADLPALARAMCARHTGIGADGLILYRETTDGASMRLLNADGSASEVSGNGVRALAAVLARQRRLMPGATLWIGTDAGRKHLSLMQREGTARYEFRADMGPPADLRRVRLEVAGETVEAGALTMGNPQCVILGPLGQARLSRLGLALQRHPQFPEGVNVELAQVESPDRVRILIWERGVGPTLSSGTGSCAAAVVAASFGGAGREVEVIAPGGAQRVEWRNEGVLLTGWAEVLLEGHWTA
jgi:diaminopimelate epimerase